MKEFAKAVVGIAAVCILGIQAVNYSVNGGTLQWCIIAITAMVLGADAVTEWVEKRKQ